MDNQHRKITGYRELTEADIDLMNLIKEFGNEEVTDVLSDVMARVAEQRYMVGRTLKQAEAAATVDEATNLAEPARAEQQRLDAAQPERWIAIARTHFQEGLMALTRAVAQPGSF
jgi:hypothetical protein